MHGDIGAMFGLGFPPHSGGPFRYVDRLGAAAVVARLEALAERHGPRFTPAPILRVFDHIISAYSVCASRQLSAN